MSVNNAGYIIGAYPCAPSFHQKSEEEEKDFWRQLADTPDIRGLEQPCLEHLHPLGDEWLLRHTPGDWQIVVTAIMETPITFIFFINVSFFNILSVIIYLKVHFLKEIKCSFVFCSCF